MADTRISDLTSGSAVANTDYFPAVETAGVGPVKKTAAQIKTYTSASPTLVTPDLGTPSAGTLTNCTGLPVSGIASIAANTFVANGTGAGASPTALSSTSATALLAAMVGDSGSGGTKGLVPAPASGDAAAAKFLKADGTWAVPAGGGSGTVNSGTAGQLAYYASSAAAVSGNANANISSGALTLGQAGSVVGSVAFGNATSGTVKLSPTTGALGTSVITLPATTGTATVLGNTTTGSGSIVLAGSPALTTPDVGTPSAGTLTNCTGLPVSTGISGLGTGVATALAVNTGSAGCFVRNNASETISGALTLTSAAPQLTLGVNATTLGQIKLFGSTSGDVTVKAAAAAGTATVFQLPANNGTSGYVLSTDGSGVTSWVAQSGGGGSPGGTTNSVQINSGSSTFTAPTTLAILGGADSGTPSSVTLRAQSGTGTDIAGGSLTLGGGLPTGAGNGGNVQFSIALPGITGTTQRTHTQIAYFSGANGHFLWNTDGTYDIGAASARPRNLNISGTLTTGGSLSIGTTSTASIQATFTSTAGSYTTAIFKGGATSGLYVGMEGTSSGGGSILAGTGSGYGVVAQTSNFPLCFAANGTWGASITTAGLLAIGAGVSSSFPAFKRSSTTIQCRLADDSAYASLTAELVTVSAGTATPAGGSTAARLLMGTTAGFGIYYGSGAPTVSAAQGSIYLRSDGSSTSTRMYINTDGATTWTNVTTAA